jgi:cation diffusion facilitator CzcD-associated flavoprotein CzcO
VVPAVADKVAHVTMLQRSPTYFITGRNANDLADMLRELGISAGVDPRDRPPQGRSRTSRRSPAARFEEPDALARDLLAGVKAQLRHDYDADTSLQAAATAPWRQRIAFVPDARPVQGHPQRQGHRWSPTRSRPSPSRASR